MNTRRSSRIDLSEADRLVTGQPAASEHAGLGTLLAAAAAPPFPQELAGERTAVTGFAQAYRQGAAGMTGSDRSRVGPAWSRTAVKAAVGFAVLVTGGTAFAAANGDLPAGVQQQAHDLFSSLGVPAPQVSTRPAGTRPTATGSAVPGSPYPTPTAGASRSTDPAPAAALGLCRAWDAERKNPHGKAITSQVRRALAVMAGGEQNIPQFCAAVLNRQHGQASPLASSQPQPDDAASGKSHPGGGNGVGHSPGHDHPTHSAHPNG